MKKLAAIYARVSTGKQSTEMQLQDLREFAEHSGWTVWKEYIDLGYSGSNQKRPALQEMMHDAKKRKFNILVVWKLDRLSRSLKDLINTLDELGSMGIDFIFYENHIDTTTPSGKLVFQIIGAVAEFEREIIRERVVAGIQNAKRKGKVLGRPKLAAYTVHRALELRKQGKSLREIGRELKVNYSTIGKRLKAMDMAA